jgi:hypothetical protein
VTAVHLLVEWLNKWQALIAGIVGFAAAILAVAITLRAERRKAAREQNEDLSSLRRALGSEMRQFTDRVLLAHVKCCDLAESGIATLEDMQKVVRFSKPVIYPLMANKLGRLGDDAYYVVDFFGYLELVNESLRQWEQQIIFPKTVGRGDLIQTAITLLSACDAGVHLLPKLRASPTDEDRDRKLVDRLSSSKEIHQKMIEHTHTV